METIIRVGSFNNYNFTEKEEQELRDVWSKKGKCFVNSNSFPVIKNTFPSIITINPYLQFVEPEGDIENVKAFRIKIVCNPNEEVRKEQERAIVYAHSMNIPILITWMRFLSRKSLNQYCIDSFAYQYDHSYYRPKEIFRKLAMDWIKTYTRRKVYQCDEKGIGCPACGNCTRLTFGQDVKKVILTSVNLSCSGDSGRCIFHCPDCFAKKILWMTKGLPKCDTLIRNRKQEGKINHK